MPGSDTTDVPVPDVPVPSFLARPPPSPATPSIHPAAWVVLRVVLGIAEPAFALSAELARGGTVAGGPLKSCRVGCVYASAVLA